jgi:hypothetical protein
MEQARELRRSLPQIQQTRRIQITATHKLHLLKSSIVRQIKVLILSGCGKQELQK